MLQLIGKKQDMTQVYDDSGNVMPVTIIDIKDNVVVAKKSVDTDGYDAIVLGKGVKLNATKAEKGKYTKDIPVPESIKESRVTPVADHEVGTNLLKDQDLTNKSVDVTGVSKGKGFQGVVKRWGFAGGPKTHGQSDRLRSPGAIGSGTTPGRVLKGKKMGGRMGGRQVTVENLIIVKHLQDEGIVLVKGAIPGPKNSNVILTIK